MTPTEEKMYLQQQAAKLYAFQKHYGVGVKQFEELMSNEWSMIVRKLMQTALDDESEQESEPSEASQDL